MNTNESMDLGSRLFAKSVKITLSVIVILVILVVFFHLYTRCYLLGARRRHLRRRSRNRRAYMAFFTANPSTSTATSVGLDQTVIKSLPVFTFSDQTHKEPIECAICLSGFEDGESGRVLPNCKHTFHVDCIDMWFHSHSTCPICRSIVEPLARNEIPTTAMVEEQVVIAIPHDPVLVIEPGPSSGSGSSAVPTDNSRRIPAAIEVPRRTSSEFVDELTRNSPTSHSFKSPMRRMLSFTRMLSRDRRSALSPIAGAPPISPSRIHMTQT